MAKTVSLRKPVPAPVPSASAAASFVGGKPAMKRLTIDLLPELHRSVKAKAAGEGVAIVDLVRGWLDAYAAGTLDAAK